MNKAAFRKRLLRLTGVAIVLGAVAAGVAVVRDTNRNPSTDDAEVAANLIGVAAQVSGRILKMHIVDNQFVTRGDLLFEIDSRPFEYALARAKSEQAVLEGQIVDLERVIRAQTSAVSAARSGVASSEASAGSAAAAVDAADAREASARAGLARSEADYQYSLNNVRRLEPLLAKQYVTVDAVDQARTEAAARSEAVNQARAQVSQSEAELHVAEAQLRHSRAIVGQSGAQLEQSGHNIATLDPLLAQRGARVAAVKNAEYDLVNCRVLAPFDGRVTGLSVSEGAYARTGERIFSLIDARIWWVIAYFRETQLTAIRPGMRAGLYVMSNPTVRFEGTVESTGFGVVPEEGRPGAEGLPAVERTLNWVHLATRFPVRVRVNNPPPPLFRIGESAEVVILGETHGQTQASGALSR
jgi:multidrug efflux system membrane fusion protein